jgi:hypothetical protein
MQMAQRTCPICIVTVSYAIVLSRSDELSCPSCNQPLELIPLSRYLATWLGLAVGVFCSWDAARSLAGGLLGWALPVLYGFIAFGLVSAAALALVGDLRVSDAPAASSTESGHASAGQH